MTTNRIVFQTKIRNINPKVRRVHVSGTGPDALFREEQLGWYLFTNDPGSLMFEFGLDDMPFKVGQSFTITLESTDANA